MGKILDFIKKLSTELTTVENQIENCTDDFERVELRYKSLSLNELIELSRNYLKSVLSNDEVNELAKEVLSPEEYNLAISTLEEKNNKAIARHVEYHQNTINTNQKSLNKLLEKYPNCASENDPNHRDYLEYTKHIKRSQDQLSNLPSLSIFSVLSPKQTDSLIKKIAEKADQLENAEEILINLEAMKPVDESEIGVQYPVKEILANFLKQHKFERVEVDQIIRNYTGFINEITAIDSMEGTKKYFDEFAREIERVTEKNFNELFIAGAKELKLSDLVDETQATFTGIHSQENLDRIYNDDFTLQHSDITKNIFATLLYEMKNKNFVLEESNIEEGGAKVYGFTKFAIAREKLIATLKAEEFNGIEFEAAFNELSQEVKNIEDMYKVLDGKVGSNYDIMPTNVENSRNRFIPRRFKKNITHNAQINSLYLTLTFIEQNNIKIEDFVNNPTKFIKEAFEREAKKLHIDNSLQLEDKTKTEAIFAIASQTEKISLDTYGYMRIVEFMNAIETDPVKRKHNAVVIAGMQQRFGFIRRTLDIGSEFFQSPSNVSETLQNIILAEKVDGKINYSECYSREVGRVTENSPEPEYTDVMEDPNNGLAIKDKPTALEKIAKMDFFQEKYYEALGMIKKYDEMLKANPNGIRQVSIKQMVLATQELCAKYLLTHNIERWNKQARAEGRDPIVSDDIVEEFMNFIKNPSLEDTLSNVNTEGMENQTLANLVKNKKSLYANKEKTMATFVKTQESAFIKLFKEINKKMDELDKRVDKIAKRIGKGETNEEIEAIGMQHRELYNQLLAAQNERIEQLRHEYETGKISKYYYEKRVEQVNTLQNLDQIPPLFEIDEPQYKDFKTYKKHVINEIMKKIENGEEAKMPENDEELKEEYKSILDRLECDKFSYLADRVLNDNGIKVLKSLSSENKFAVSSQLLNINEKVYREEYTQYIEHNQKVNTQLLSQEQPQTDGLLAPEPIEVPDASVEAIQINEQVQPIEEKLEIDELPYDMQRKNTNVV